MKIRLAHKSDAQLIAENNQALAKETEDKNLKNELIIPGVKSVLNNPEKGFYLILEIDGNPAGQLMVTTEWSDWRNGHFWWIQSVYVHNEYRKLGVYRALHEETRKRAKAAGNVVGIRLYVDNDNTDAQKVYRQMGMVESNYKFYEEEWS